MPQTQLMIVANIYKELCTKPIVIDMNWKRLRSPPSKAFRIKAIEIWMKSSLRIIHVQLTASILQRRIGVGHQLLKIGLEPCTGLRCWLKCISEATMSVITSRARIGSSLFNVSIIQYPVATTLTSHSPPGLIQTNASSRGSPVFVVGLTPNPVPLTLL
jgi:hypothetical protein